MTQSRGLTRQLASQVASRREVLAGAASLAGALALPGSMAASTSSYRLKHGSFEIIVFSDGHIVQPTSNLAPSAPEEARAQILKAAGQTGETFTSPLNVALIRTPSELILVDAGGGASFQPTAGKIMSNLEAMGILSHQIGKVIVTHGHADHLWGLVDTFNDAQFPNAQHFVSAVERDYWLGPDAFKGIDEARHGFVTGARRIFPILGDRLTMVKGGDEIVPGVRVIDTKGHSPGHLSVEVAGEGSLVIVSDAITHPLISFVHPEWRSRGDQDAELGIATRQRLLDRVATDKIRILCYHLPYPGIGFVERNGKAYRFVPVG